MTGRSGAYPATIGPRFRLQGQFSSVGYLGLLCLIPDDGSPDETRPR